MRTSIQESSSRAVGDDRLKETCSQKSHREPDAGMDQDACPSQDEVGMEV